MCTIYSGLYSAISPSLTADREIYKNQILPL
nr:MAG TPA: hypothetical protein [Crassvirales sp.]